MLLQIARTKLFDPAFGIWGFPSFKTASANNCFLIVIGMLKSMTTNDRTTAIWLSTNELLCLALISLIVKLVVAVRSDFQNNGLRISSDLKKAKNQDLSFLKTPKTC